jgi:hypothetical protein
MGRMRDQVDAGLADAASTARDAGAVELLRTYADLIDDAGVPGKYTEALDWLVGVGAASEDKAADKHVRAILLGLSRQTATSDLGPKLLAAMEALQMTPRARKAAAPGSDRNGSKSPIAQLRDEVSEKRRRRAGNVG